MPTVVLFDDVGYKTSSNITPAALTRSIWLEIRPREAACMASMVIVRELREAQFPLAAENRAGERFWRNSVTRATKKRILAICAAIMASYSAPTDSHRQFIRGQC